MLRRVQLKQDPLFDLSVYRFNESAWPARWVGPQRFDPDASLALMFRRQFELASPQKVRLHLSADQVYELCLDGKYLARGPQRGELHHWPYESFDLTLEPGKHTLAIKVWWISPSAPAAEAQQTHRPSLLVFAEGQANDLLSTGVAQWEYRQLPGYRFCDHHQLFSYFATGAQLVMDGREIDPQVEVGQGEGWQPVKVVDMVALVSMRRQTNPWWLLQPANLPPLHEKTLQIGVARQVEEVSGEETFNVPVDPVNHLSSEAAAWNDLLSGGNALTVPPHTKRRLIIDLEDYCCAFPGFTCSGDGARVRLHLAESLYHVEPGRERHSMNPKGNRDEINGKCFYGVGYEFTAGSREHTYRPHAFAAGRYVELMIQTSAAPLLIRSFSFLETHFPFKFSARFESSNPAHKQIIAIALRTVEMCSHDTSMDCPYYERLNYIGDTRLQTLVAYTAADEDRLARRCIELFDQSRQAHGFTSSRYPARPTQLIPPFSLWWIGMVWDFARWRNDPAFVQQRMLGVRGVLEAWRSHLSDNGLLRAPAGWNFVDWVPSWKNGVPAGGNDSFSCTHNLQAIYTLRLAADLEDLVGEQVLARRSRELAKKLTVAVQKAFFNRRVGLFADDLEQKFYSEHAQSLAVLAGVVSARAAGQLMDRMLARTDLAQPTIYFSHYLFEALGQTGRMDAILQRLRTWEALRGNGLKTTPEQPEPTRSDCHAWGAHPVYHFLATFAGIRPADFGFHSAVIRPQFGSLKHLEGRMPHRNGMIEIELDLDGKALTGSIKLPKDLPATLEFASKVQKLRAGENRV
jgi:hypothetical protein